MNAPRDFIRANPELVGQRALRGVILREKFVQGRVKQTNRCRSSFERFEDADEIAFLCSLR